MAYLTLADLGRRMGPDGSIDDIAETLAQCNEIFDDMLWREGNQPLGHTGTIRTGLPQGTWRNFYQGVAFTKSTTAQVTDTIGELVAYSRIDRSLAELEGNVAALRLSEDNAHLEGLSQQMATTFFYGNELVTQAQFTGLAPRFNTITSSNAQNAVNCLSAGGSASSNASIWLACWGEQTGFGFYPKGSRAGLVFEDKGDIRPGFDSNNREFEAYTSLFMWKAGLHIKNWQYFVRICNIDVTTAGLAGTTPPDLFALMSKAVVRLPTAGRRVSGITKVDAPNQPAPAMRPAWYVNRTVRQYLDIQAIRDKNVLLTPREYDGQPIVDFRGVPIRICDALTSSESALS
jgi:hypothetical protein